MNAFSRIDVIQTGTGISDFIGFLDNMPSMADDDDDRRSPYITGRDLLDRLSRGDLASLAPVFATNKPLALGIDEELTDRLVMADMVIDRDVVRAAILAHTRRPAYLRQVGKSRSQRHDLDGVPVADVLPAHRRDARGKLEVLNEDRDRKKLIADRRIRAARRRDETPAPTPGKNFPVLSLKKKPEGN